MTDSNEERERLRRTDAFATVSGLFQGLVVVSQFVRSWVRSWIEEAGVKTEVDAVALGQLLRVDSWLRTLCKLNEPGDFQAVASACRALLETTIDIALIHDHPGDYKKILAWEESAKLRYAEQLARYLSSSKTKPPADHRYVVAFATKDKKRIETLRTTFGWVNKKDRTTRHPDRWTNRSLADDAKRADMLGHSFQFERFYETEYRKLCWLVHGSAFAVRSVQAEHFPGVAGLLFPSCADMGLLSSEIVLKQLGLWSAERDHQFSEVKARRTLVAAQTRRASLDMPLIGGP